MLEHLISADSAMFVGINQTLSNPLSDLLMPIVTNDMYLRIGFALVLSLLLWRGDWRLRVAALVSLLALALADLSSSAFLKPLLARARPCHDLSVFPQLKLLVSCGAGFALPSSHAANAFSVATFFAIITPTSRKYIFFIASVVAISRVFVGVHYPGDILAGSALGVICGGAMALVFQKLWQWRESTFPTPTH